jgi:hypothetical protein
LNSEGLPDIVHCIGICDRFMGQEAHRNGEAKNGGHIEKMTLKQYKLYKNEEFYKTH